MRVELICIGDELLRGDVADSHTGYVGRRLSEMGTEIARVSLVADDETAIRSVLVRSLREADRVIVTGGLGPTEDDVTLRAVAAHFDLGLREDPEVLDGIRRRFRAHDRPMPPCVVRQALVPDGFRVLPNRWGTAPGLARDTDGCVLYLLPGPPVEMRGVFDEHVLPELQAAFAEGAGVHRRVLLVAGAGESEIQETLAGLLPEAAGLRIGYRALTGELWVRLTAPTAQGLEVACREARARLGLRLAGEGDTNLARATGDLLSRARLTLATAESCTGGLLGGRLTSVPGSSDWYLGGIVSYSNDAKQSLLGVPASVLAEHGAVSAETAAHMAAGARSRLAAHVAVAVTGIAGPAGGAPGKPVGLTFFAVATDGATETERRVFGADRATNRRWAVSVALDLVRRTVLCGMRGPASGTPGSAASQEA